MRRRTSRCEKSDGVTVVISGYRLTDYLDKSKFKRDLGKGKAVVVEVTGQWLPHRQRYGSQRTRCRSVVKKIVQLPNHIWARTG